MKVQDSSCVIPGIMSKKILSTIMRIGCISHAPRIGVRWKWWSGVDGGYTFRIHPFCIQVRQCLLITFVFERFSRFDEDETTRSPSSLVLCGHCVETDCFPNRLCVSGKGHSPRPVQYYRRQFGGSPMSRKSECEEWWNWERKTR